MAKSLSSSCFLWFFKSVITILLFSSHYSQQLLRIVLALALFFTLLTSIAICAFFDLYFFLISGSQTTGDVINVLNLESLAFLSSSAASFTILIVSLSSVYWRLGISELTLAILSVKYRAILSFFYEQCSTSFRQSMISFVRFCLFLTFLKASSCPSTSQMNYYLRLLESQFLVGEVPYTPAYVFFFIVEVRIIIICHQITYFITFIMMQENRSIVSLISLLKGHVTSLRTSQQQLKQQNEKNASFKEIIGFYEKELIPKLNERSAKSNVCSDLLMWYAPKQMVLLYKIHQILASIPQVQMKVSVENTEMLQEQENASVQSLLRSSRQFIVMSLLPCVEQFSQWFKKSGNVKQAQKLNQFHTMTQNFLKEQNQIVDVALPPEQYESKILGSLYKDVPLPKSRITIKFAYRFLFIAKLKLRVKKALKHIDQRRQRIHQLVQGQRNYIAGLNDYIQYIKNPICNLNILSELQTKKMFSTIQSILGFHKFLQKELRDRYEKYHKYQTYGDLIRRNIPFFKLYTDYIQYADEAQAMLLKLEETNEDVKAICSKFMLEKQKKASDQLKQPTFRIARYGTIISEILKNTSPIHPDYQLLKQASKEATINLTKINETVDGIARRARLHQLDRQFGTQERPIFIPQRNFIDQFHLLLINDDKIQPVFVFIFNDLLIIIDQNRKILKEIIIDSKFYVRREEDNKTYRNIVKIHSDGFITFSAGNQQRHNSKADSFFKILKGLSKNNIDVDRMVNVHVIGTQQINSSTFNKYTEYIAEIKYLGLRKFSRLRFSLMKAFVQKAQEFYKNDLGICLDEGLKDGWFSNYNSKTIEDRKRAIQQILQKMLNNPLIQGNPAFLLNELGIEPSFFKTLPMSDRKREKQRYEFVDQVSSPLLRGRSSRQKQVREAQTILCATQIKLGRDSYHDPEYATKKVTQSERFTIDIYTMVGQQAMAIKINDLYTVEDVCYEVSNLLDLKTNRDFRLFHEVGKRELRVLDNDKKIIKLFSSIKKESKNSESYLSDLFSALKSYVMSEPPPKLIFKKYYFLPKEIQHSQCKKDTTRLRLIVYQIFYQIKQMKYNLSFEDYLLFLAALIYIEYDGQVPEQTEASYVARVIPEKIFKIKNEPEEYWLQQCRPHLIWLQSEISKIIEYNKQKVKNKRIRPDSAIHFEHRHICSQIVISKIRTNSIYGSNLFYVQLSKQTYEKFQKEGKKPVYNMWLAIKVDRFMLMSPTAKDNILEVQLKEIEKIIVETQGVIFKIESLALCEYSLNTYQSFQISELVKYYKCLAETLEEFENNKILQSKTKVYKRQLQSYRASYDKAERQTTQVQTNKDQLLQALGLIE